MDPQNIAALVAFAPVIIAPIAAALAKIAEKVPVFPYEGASKLGIVTALVVASFACRVGLAWVTGTLSGIAWEAEVRLVVEAIAGALIAAGGYALTNNDKPALPPLN